MEDFFMEYVFPIVIVIVILILIRSFGAWMFRIDEVIKHQKEILEELKKTNSSNKT